MKIVLEAIDINGKYSSETYRSEDCQHLISMWRDYYPKIGFQQPWIGYMVKLDGQVAGSCSFNGPPDKNTVEVSYWTFKEYEGKGIATLACKQLIEIARAADPSLKIIAKTAPERNASTSILMKCGFVFSGVVQDHKIGDAWQWTFKDEN